MLKPRIKKHLDVVSEPRGGYYIRSSESISVLKGATVKELFDKLLPLLNGSFSEGEIIQKLDKVAQPEVVRVILGRLQEAKIIEDAAEEGRYEFSQDELDRYRHQLVFFDLALHSGNALDYQLNLKNSRFVVIGAGPLALSLARQASGMGVGRILAANLCRETESSLAQTNPSIHFSAAGLDFSDWGKIAAAIKEEQPTLLALAIDRPEPILTEAVNTLAIELNLSLLNCQTNGIEGIIGPLVVPGQTACLKCHHTRVTRNLDFYAEYNAWEKWVRSHAENRAITAQLAPFTDTVAGMAAIEVLKHASGCYEAETYGRFITINALTFEIVTHQVLKLPRCPSCGSAREKNTYSPWREL